MVNSHSPPGRKSNDLVVVVNPFGPHQRERCSSVVNASNTNRRGASMNRSTTISRSYVVSGCSISPFLSLQFLGIRLETVESLAPEPLEAAGPFVHFPQTTGAQAVEAMPTPRVHVDQSDLLQDLQVLRRRRLGEAEPLGDGADRLLPVLQHREDPAALRDRKSTRLNSSHVKISYAVFCLNKKKSTTDVT